MKNKILIIDFDSTFIALEGLEELARIALKSHLLQKDSVEQLEVITNLGMEGKISFRQSLTARFSLFTFSKRDIWELKNYLQKHITPSIDHNREFIKKHADKIYIISGGFKEWIYPIIKDFGIEENHVLANEFIFDSEGIVTGFDESNPLSDSGGKVQVVRDLGLLNDIIVIGDGYTDYEIKKEGLANQFIVFTENLKRNTIVKYADKVVDNFDEIVSMEL